jgi:nucleoside-diphosphate-sugar epimerase
VIKHYPHAEIGFEPDPARQALADSWPGDVDATLAQKDWGFSPRHGLTQALADYLVPAMKKLYPASA